MSAPAPNESVVAQLGPYEVQLEAGSDYYFCTCGRSTTQPFCSGKHKGTGFKPHKFTPKETGPFWVCGCKQTTDPDFMCNGTHNSAETAKKYNKQLLQANTVLRDQVAAQKQQLTFAFATAAAAIVVAAAIYLRAP